MTAYFIGLVWETPSLYISHTMKHTLYVSSEVIAVFTLKLNTNII